VSISYQSAYSGGYTNGATGATSLSVTLSAVPTGYTLCVSVLFNQTGPSYTCTDNASGGSNTYITAAPSLINTAGTDMLSWLCKSVAGNPTVVTVAQSGGITSTYDSLAVDCFSGVASSTLIDGSNSQYQAAPGGGTNAISSGTFTVGHSGDLLYSAGVSDNAGVVVGTGFTAGLQATIGSNTGYMWTEYNLSVASGSKAGTWTDSAAPADAFTLAFALQPQANTRKCTRSMMGVGCGIWAAKKLDENPIITRRGLLVPRRDLWMPR
jgi:hypothetical protein